MKNLNEFELALFHDRNSREAEAIPLYRTALKKGLTGVKKAQAHAYLASSLWKVGKPNEALKIISDSQKLKMPLELRVWIERLQKRVEREPNRFK